MMADDRRPAVRHLPVGESVREMHDLVAGRGSIEQRAQLQPLDAYRFPLGAPEHVVDQWQAAMDRLCELALAVTD